MKNYFDMLKKHMSICEGLKLIFVFVTGALFVELMRARDFFDFVGMLILLGMFVWLDVAAITNFELLDSMEDEAA